MLLLGRAGTIPESWDKLKALVKLDLKETGLETTLEDRWGNLGGDKGSCHCECALLHHGGQCVMRWHHFQGTRWRVAGWAGCAV